MNFKEFYKIKQKYEINEISNLDDAKKVKMRSSLEVMKRSYSPLQNSIEAGNAKTSIELCKEIQAAATDIINFFQGV